MTVRNGERWLIVMMLSVTVWSCTDRWSVCPSFWRRASERRRRYGGGRNADFQTCIFNAPGRNHFWDDTDQYADFVTLTSINAFRRIDSNVLQVFWRTENESEGQFNTNWQADCTRKSVQHMSGCFSPERYKLACQQKVLVTCDTDVHLFSSRCEFASACLTCLHPRQQMNANTQPPSYPHLSLLLL